MASNEVRPRAPGLRRKPCSQQMPVASEDDRRRRMWHRQAAVVHVLRSPDFGECAAAGCGSMSLLGGKAVVRLKGEGTAEGAQDRLQVAMQAAGWQCRSCKIETSPHLGCDINLIGPDPADRSVSKRRWEKSIQVRRREVRAALAQLHSA